MKIKAGIIGATGYTGEEIIKVLLGHSAVQITSLTAVIDKPTIFSDLFPYYRGTMDLVCEQLDVKKVCERTELVFLALPHTVSMQYAPVFLKAGKKVIDLSADYRLDAETFRKWYKAEHSDTGNIPNAVYGMPEIFKEPIKSAKLLANPGCYPTASLLSVLPALKKGIVGGPVIFDAKSGVTGAGRRGTIPLSYGEADGNLKAYKLNEHQHLPEIEKIMRSISSEAAATFVPHLVPMRRGILVTAYIPLKGSLTDKDAAALYRDFYKDAPFVRISAQGRYPEIKDVVYTNNCDIGMKVSGGLLIVVSCIDNLLKGASGQAVQNMNIMCGFPEEEGLR